MNQAIDKIRDEMAANTNDPYIQYVGGYLTTYVMAHPDTAAAIMAEGKTIKGSLEAAKSKAKPKASNGVAVMADEEVFAVVLEYYGITGEKTKTADACGFGLDLDDLLGE